MPATKLTNFGGIAPRVSPELLPDNAAQTAFNTKLETGNIIPYKEPTAYAHTGRYAEVKKLFALRDPETNDPVFLSWETDVDVVMADADIEDEQRFYYTGDGVPKVSTYKLATSGNAPYPIDYYELGLPLPQEILSITAVSHPSVSIKKIVRDSGSIATATTSSAHGFRTGNTISVTGCDASTSDTATFNTTNSKCTVLSDTQFTYFSPGEEATVTNKGTASLAGNLFTRTYVFTWYTPWGEESIASDPSNTLYVREGQTVKVDSLPRQRPDGKNYIRGMKLYRTLNSASSATYAYLTTLWFPSQVGTYYRKDNQLYITMVDPHYMIAGDLFSIKAASGDSILNVTGGEVNTIVDKYTFVVDSSGNDTTTYTARTGTVLYRDISPIEQDTPYYWGLTGWYVNDTYTSSYLTDILSSEYNEAPPKDLQGIRVFTSGIYCGFRKNQIFFSEQDKPYAWPAENAITFDANIVSLAVSGIYLIALTDGAPYVISGNTPKTLSYQQADYPYPCLSKRSVVQMGYGVAYATRGGIAVYNPSEGITKVTENIHTYDTWTTELDPSTIAAVFYQDKYLAAHSKGGFSFAKDPGKQAQQQQNALGGVFITLDIKLTAAWVDQVTGIMYYVPDTSGYIMKFDDKDSPAMMFEWKSKVITTKDYMNFGAARIKAVYDNEENYNAIVAWNQNVSAYNTLYWSNKTDLSAANGPNQFTDAEVLRSVFFGSFNGMPINGDNVTITQRAEERNSKVIFRLWHDKKLVYQNTIEDDSVFRLPTGYRSDTIEFAINSDTRVKEIHIGETPFGLRQA